MLAIIYSRVSTDAQERDGTSLDTQERACVQYAKEAGYQVLSCIRDTASGSTLDRPGIERLRQILRSGAADVVIAYAVDRLSRNQNHIGILFDEVEQANVKLEFVTEVFEDTAIGRFILAARAFSAEVEREKIAERTMRGKAERARSGRLPQGTGKGIYGYNYDKNTGRREINDFQARVIQKIFSRYAESRSFSAVSQELNDAGVPAFSGGRWYPPTIRRVVINESYTGNSVYRKTKRIKVRNPKTGGWKSTVIDQPKDEWISVVGCTPRIIDDVLWQRVKGIINDPERIRNMPTTRFYSLKGRIKCGKCGSAMVGQTLTPKKRPISYYRCRHAYDHNTGHSCSARYVRCDRLEQGVWNEITKVLTNPEIVLGELKRMASETIDATEIERLELALGRLRDREKRLAHLYTLGSMSEEAIRQEGTAISAEKSMLEGELGNAKSKLGFTVDNVDADQLKRVCAAVAEWLAKADDQQRILALEALQIGVQATKDEATVMLPLEVPKFITIEQTSGCVFTCDKPAHIPEMPFIASFSLTAPGRVAPVVSYCSL